MICHRDPATSLSKILSKRVVGGLVVAVFVTIMLLRLEVVDLAHQSNQVAGPIVAPPKPAAPLSSPAPPPTPETPETPSAPATPEPEPVTYLYKNQDKAASTSPFYIQDFCNKLPAPRNPRGLLVSKPKDQPIVIFFWRQVIWDMFIDWKKESKTLCPIPLSLQPFFNHYREKRTGYSEPWENGYAPCIFWSMSFNTYDDKHGSCNTTTNGNLNYVITSNYTRFEEADLVHMSFPYFDGTNDPPYYDTQLMPPRIAHQKWVFQFQGESVGYYPFAALPAYLQQFDLTIGTPASMVDVPLPFIEMTPTIALSYANIKPGYPLDKTPEHSVGLMVRNCAARNNRNALIDAMISGLNAHSYGACRNNIDIPEEINKPGKSWVAVKQETLAGYPFVLAAENSNCMGYISEKIYDAFAVGAIPIYMGAPDITKYVPEGSFINVADFKDFDELVRYVKTVDRAPFYKWKEIVKKDPSKFCKGCMPLERRSECIMMEKVHYV
ncbi:putative glycoprotein 3-alpha-L-fucosyltransferase [Mortierella alpina]|nr:putative glycoprotein 3-alpha-L-fucosyltransferase [Mortierella alpina]